MMASDKHLDAEWKRIQKKTFTRWCNEHLKANMLKIEELTTDLSDGVKLIVLLELLSQKKLGRYNKRPRVHAQKMENVQLCLDFITKKERIRLVNIGKYIVFMLMSQHHNSVNCQLSKIGQLTFQLRLIHQAAYVKLQTTCS